VHFLLLFPFLTWVNPITKGIFCFMSLIQANNIRIQRGLSKYKNKKEFADTLHMLRFSIGLKIPKHVKRFLNWCADMNGNSNSSYGTGAFFHSEEKIAEEIGCSLSTVERAIKWLKRRGLLSVVPSWNYNEDKRGTAYKIFSEPNVAKTIIKALITQNDQVVEKLTGTLNEELNGIVKKLTGTVTGTVTDTETEENADIPRDEPAQNSTHKRPNIKDQYKKDINNYNTPPTQNAEGGQLKSKIDLSIIDSKTMELLNGYKNFANYNFWDDDLKTEMVFWIQTAINKAGADVTKLEHRHVIKEAVGTVINQYNNDKPKRELTKLMYRSVKEILEQVILGEREVGATKEKPKAGRNKKANKPYYGKKPTRKEILPDWFNGIEAPKEEQQQEMSQEEYEKEKEALAKELAELFSVPQMHASATEAHTGF
jgi:Mn-dependent DtxR family transcriptional regulator